MTAGARRFYRIVVGNAPVRWDFMSNAARGLEPKRPLTARDQDRWRGLSVFDSFEAAVVRRHDSPLLGSHVAEITIPPDAEVRVEQTSRNRAHFTLWADPNDLLEWVTAVRHAEAVD